MMGAAWDDATIPEPDLDDARVEQLLAEIKRNSRSRRLVLLAPAALAAAVVMALLAGPPRYGGLDLLPEAQASGSELPRVFGSNGVWRLPEPIAAEPDAAQAVEPGPGAVVETPSAPASPDFVLAPPTEEDLQSLPVSAPTPPAPTLGQSLADEVEPEDLDWSRYQPEIRVTALETDDLAEATAVDADADAETSEDDEVIVVAADDGTDEQQDVVEDGPNAGIADDEQGSAPETSADAEATTPPQLSSTDEDVHLAEQEPTGEPADNADAGDPAQANPSTPSNGPTDQAPSPSAMASIELRSVLVYSAHVSVTVQVVDDDSPVIDWCNTRVDWGDGSITRVTNVDVDAACTAHCEYAATTSTPGVNEELNFSHEYRHIIDASPRIFVATGDSCSYTLAELQLTPFTVVPY